MSSKKDDPLETAARKSIEVAGQRVVYLVRPQKDTENQASEFSFDGGKSWTFDRALAYNRAKEAGLLRYEGQIEDRNDPDFEVWLLELVNLIGELGNGDSLKVSKMGDMFIVTKEVVSLTCRASTVQDVKLSMKEDKRDG